jgi:LysR family transcriptional regulator, nitrogen assimilation regulatory protein
MDIRKLRYFVGVAEMGGFRRAAEALCVAQPALSRHVRQLETELNSKLFDRTNIGVRLTQEGRLLYSESKEILQRVDNLADMLAQRRQGFYSTVRLGAPSSIAELLFGPLTERLHANYPHLHVVVLRISLAISRIN